MLNFAEEKISADSRTRKHFDAASRWYFIVIVLLSSLCSTWLSLLVQHGGVKSQWTHRQTSHLFYQVSAEWTLITFILPSVYVAFVGLFVCLSIAASLRVTLPLLSVKSVMCTSLCYYSIVSPYMTVCLLVYYSVYCYEVSFVYKNCYLQVLCPKDMFEWPECVLVTMWHLWEGLPGRWRTWEHVFTKGTEGWRMSAGV